MIRLLFVCCMAIALTACGQHLKHTDSAAKYTEALSKKSLPEIQKQVKEDTAWLQSLINDAEDIYLVNGFMMSGGNASGEWQPAKPFVFEQKDTTQLTAQWQQMRQWLEPVEIERGESYNNIKIATLDSTPENIADLAKETETNIVKIFAGGKALDSGKTTLARVDSVWLKATLDVPLAYVTLQLQAGKKTYNYNNKPLHNIRFRKKNAEFDLPVELYKNVLGVQALNKNGVLMDKNGYSAFPAVTVRQDMVNAMQQLLKKLTTAMQATSETAAAQTLQGITDNEINIKNQLKNYTSFIKSYGDKNLKAKDIRAMMEKGKDVLEVAWQSIEAAFPDDVATLYVYMATDKKHYEQQLTALNADTANYNVFSEKVGERNKEGISDAAGNIIIPATYYEVYPENEFYYLTRKNKDDKYILNYLNVAEKKLETLKGYRSFYQGLTKDVAIFRNDADQLVVLKNHKEQLLPHTYKEIMPFGNYLLCHDSTSEVWEIYDNHYKKTGKTLKDFDVITDDLLSVRDGELYGMMNTNLAWVAPPKYEYHLKPFAGSKNLFVAALNTADKYGYGVIDKSGHTVVPFVYDDIYDSPQPVSRIICEQNGLYGFLDNKGRVAIPPQFTKVDLSGFIKGYAFVYTKTSFGIINEDGKYVLKDAKGDMVDSDGSGTNTTYTINGSTYNYKGDKIK